MGRTSPEPGQVRLIPDLPVMNPVPVSGNRRRNVCFPVTEVTGRRPGPESGREARRGARGPLRRVGEGGQNLKAKAPGEVDNPVGRPPVKFALAGLDPGPLGARNPYPADTSPGRQPQSRRDCRVVDAGGHADAERVAGGGRRRPDRRGRRVRCGGGRLVVRPAADAPGANPGHDQQAEKPPERPHV